MNRKTGYWTNPSIIALAGTQDPVEIISRKARAIILEYAEEGKSDPPFDPFAIAAFLKISVVPKEDILDARTIYSNGDKVTIEFNPNRPKGRIRYSIAHEIIHTLFPDCHERIRNRESHETMKGDQWQLEMLCNIGASELLMPIGSFPDLKEESLSIDSLMGLRKKYDVSTEALLLRFARRTERSCCVFSASRREDGSGSYQIDYTIPSGSFQLITLQGITLPKSSVVKECTAIGYTSKGSEIWPTLSKVIIECVGIPPYPGRQYPRVMGIVRSDKSAVSEKSGITYLKGDARNPRGTDHRIIAHVVNDKTPRWGAGFPLEIKKKWPDVQEEFEIWALESRADFSLGNIHLYTIDRSLSIVHMICQRGYGPSEKPRIKYKAVKECLDQLASIALKRKASIHMPRIGCGQAGGSWAVISELIDESLSQKGLTVTVYDLPNSQLREEPQPMLDFTGVKSAHG